MHSLTLIILRDAWRYKFSAPHGDEYLDCFFWVLTPCDLIAGVMKTEATSSSETLYPLTILHDVTTLKTRFLTYTM
jgi:hypothetical protein